MKWSEMTSMERDTLVSEKVHRLPDICPGKPTIREVTTPSRDGGIAFISAIWICDTCYACGHCDIEYVPKDHAPIVVIPHYSTDMDAAWKIIKKMISFENETFGRFCSELLDTESEGIHPASEAIRRMAKFTPEKICLAALKACDVEIEA